MSFLEISYERRPVRHQKSKWASNTSLKKMPVNAGVLRGEGNGKAKVIPEMKFADRNGIAAQAELSRSAFGL
jgi:hypothetical protein